MNKLPLQSRSRFTSSATMLPAQASKVAASHTKTTAVPVQKEAGELPRWDLCSGGTAPTASTSWILMPQTLDMPALWGLGVWATANHSTALCACHKVSSHGRGSSSISISISTGQDAKYVLWELWCEDAYAKSSALLCERIRVEKKRWLFY
jgi:hypothetical protein